MQASGSSSVLPLATARFGMLRHLALLAGVALLNPYTLFGVDTGAYWLAAFAAPVALALAYLGVEALMQARSGSGRARSFIRLSALLQVLVLAAQWADV